jgi:hypothetical protein
VSEPQHDKAPELHFTNAKQLTFEQMMDLFRKLTGREPNESVLRLSYG